ncbi:hypothetical protein VP01_966g4 [Puccinia sorghi]|uniref:Uncharacterized protein n=1 Tax=Puccinia sorghi TaxID=27349 RepID=A0A0L6U6K9_9BASI|nr:hypothetical protein VP01_966g4 [Puccinia sorghi]
MKSLFLKWISQESRRYELLCRNFHTLNSNVKSGKHVTAFHTLSRCIKKKCKETETHSNHFYIIEWQALQGFLIYFGYSDTCFSKYWGKFQYKVIFLWTVRGVFEEAGTAIGIFEIGWDMRLTNSIEILQRALACVLKIVDSLKHFWLTLPDPHQLSSVLFKRPLCLSVTTQYCSSNSSIHQNIHLQFLIRSSTWLQIHLGKESNLNILHPSFFFFVFYPLFHFLSLKCSPSRLSNHLGNKIIIPIMFHSHNPSRDKPSLCSRFSVSALGFVMSTFHLSFAFDMVTQLGPAQETSMLPKRRKRAVKIDLKLCMVSGSCRQQAAEGGVGCWGLGVNKEGGLIYQEKIKKTREFSKRQEKNNEILSHILITAQSLEKQFSQFQCSQKSLQKKTCSTTCMILSALETESLSK